MNAWGGHTQGGERVEVYDSLAEARARFGENWGAFEFRLTRAQVEALLQGRVVAFDINQGEYAGFLVVEEAEHEDIKA
jgi:hypothetical protein